MLPSPYLHIPIALPGSTGEPGKDDKTVTAKILPEYVQFYHEGHSWGTFVYMQNGHALCCTWTLEQYERAINKYWETVIKEASKSPILKSIK